MDGFLTANGKLRRFIVSEGLLRSYNSKGFVKWQTRLEGQTVSVFRRPFHER